MKDRNLTPVDAAAETAEDTEEEFGVPTSYNNGTARINMAEEPEDSPLYRFIYGYADTTAVRSGLDFEFRKLDTHEETGGYGPVIEVEYSEKEE